MLLNNISNWILKMLNTTYVLLSDIYAAAGKRDLSEKAGLILLLDKEWMDQ